MSSHCVWPLWFLMRNQLWILLRVPCTWWAISLFLLSRFSLSFDSSIMMCLGMAVFEFIILAVCWASWISRLCFLKFFMFLSIVSKGTFCPFLSLLSFWDSHYVYVGTVDGVPQISEAVHFSSFFCLFLFFILDNLVCLCSSSLILLSAASLLLVSPL